jgi:hypothetical protein
MNTTLRVAYSNGGTLPDYAAPRVKTVSMQCCLQSPGTTYSSDYGSVNAAHSDYSTDFPGGYPNNGAASFVEGRWQHVVITFDGSGTQTGVFWNGQQRARPRRGQLSRVLAVQRLTQPHCRGSVGHLFLAPGSVAVWAHHGRQLCVRRRARAPRAPRLLRGRVGRVFAAPRRPF